VVEASQIAQMRFSMYFALSSSGATLSAANSRSRFCVLSPRWARGSTLGGSIGLSGSGSTVSAGAGDAQDAARIAAAIHAMDRWLMRASLALRRRTIKTKFPCAGNLEVRSLLARDPQWAFQTQSTLKS